GHPRLSCLVAQDADARERAGMTSCNVVPYVSTARGLGKQAEHVENQWLALEIVGLRIGGGAVEALPRVGDPRKPCGLGSAVELGREPVARGFEKDLEQVVVAVEAVAERM